MQLYHGSETIIEKPLYRGGKSTNDYGRGFYCTENIELAKEWACANNNSGYANIYSIDLTGLRILNLNSSEYNILNWLAILARHRTYWQKGSISEQAKQYIYDNFYINVDEYDIIIGHRADDSYFSFAQDFVSGAISLKKLSEAMQLGKLGEQIVLKSSKAFGALKYCGYEPAEADIYFEKKCVRDLEARRQYRAAKKTSADINDIYILDIMREGMKNGDPRLQ